MMAEVKVDKHTGLVSPPVNPCYQDANYLCELRRKADSQMMCAYKIEIGCPFMVKQALDARNEG